MVNEVLDGFELPPEKVHLVPNGVDIQHWHAGASRPAARAARRRLGPDPVREGLPGARPGDRPPAPPGARHPLRHRRARRLPRRAADPDRRRGRRRPRPPRRLRPRRRAARRCCAAPAASSSRRCTSRSASSPWRAWPPARRRSSPAPAGSPRSSRAPTPALLFEPGQPRRAGRTASREVLGNDELAATMRAKAADAARRASTPGTRSPPRRSGVYRAANESAERQSDVTSCGLHGPFTRRC